MRTFHRLTAFFCAALLTHPALATTSQPTLTPRQQKAVNSAMKFLSFVDKPERRTHRQVFQMFKPFGQTAMVEHLEKEMTPLLDRPFPRMKVTDKGENLEIRLGSGSTHETLTVRKNDEKVFGVYRNVEILWSDMTDGVEALKKMEMAAKGGKTSALHELLFPRAHALDWGLVLGLGLIGAGIAAGLFFLSRARTQHQVHGTTTHNVVVPTNYNLNTEHAITAPQVDPYLPPRNTQGVR